MEILIAIGVGIASSLIATVITSILRFKGTNIMTTSQQMAWITVITGVSVITVYNILNEQVLGVLAIVVGMLVMWLMMGSRN